MRRIVLDTNVLVAGLRSRRGASFRLLSRVGRGAFEIALSVPLVFEYEEVLLRHRRACGLDATDIHDVLDYFCRVGRRQEIFYLWRPLLRDARDDFVVELAVAAGCDSIITFNGRDFAPVGSFGLRILSPAELLEQLGELS